MPEQLYAVLRHDRIERPHFDLMFQTSLKSLLTTWRVPVWRPEGEMIVEQAADHRLAYLTFEGEISGGRGHVRRVEQGICEVERVGNEWTVRLRPVPEGEGMVIRIYKGVEGWRCGRK